MESKTSINIEHDGLVSISVGRSRREKNWINRKVKWSELLNKLSKTQYTNESFEEYKGLSKEKQDDIKDVGGFVGGTLRNGRRRNENLESRSLITLDADFANAGLWESIKEKFHYTCCMYSTHRHSPNKPRYRIVIPLSRSLTSEEYQAVSRRVAQDLGMEMFDDTTHEPARLMYWPSTSRDGVFEFYYQDGKWLDCDEVLKSYDNWRDAGSWPRAEISADVIRAQKKRQGDPKERKGVAGAFNRTYSVPQAIEKFLSDVYEPVVSGERYTYKKGTTTGGLVVYDGGDFAYSFHGTDPAGGRLTSAYDLVRLHRFGHLDREVEGGTPVAKLPSSQAMREFASEDDMVKLTLGKERIADSHMPENMDGEDMEWLKLMEVDRKGRYVPSISNAVIILENDPNLKGKIGVNEFSCRVVRRGDLPWCRLENRENGDIWEDRDDAALRYYIEKVYGISCPRKIDDARMVVQEKNRFHPVRDYINSLTWDGVKRVETLFIDYLGAEDSKYTRAVTRKMLAGACARVFRPGIKFDYMLVLTGGQGIGKSQLLRLLGRSWFSDSVMSIQGKEGFEQLQGVWILEMGELTATRKSAVEHVKQYISKSEDYYRPAYGKHVTLFQRQCVMFGTTNDMEFLRDQTGNRRFWPLYVGVVREKSEGWKALTDEVVDQIWAEAYEIYKNGEELYLSGDLEMEAKERQELHTEISINEGVIMEFLDLLLPEDWDKMNIYERRGYIHDPELRGRKPGVKVRNRVCAAEIWAERMRGDIKDPSAKAFIRDIHSILNRIEGWKPYTRGTGRLRFGFYGPQKAYVRIGSEEDI